MYNCWLIFIWVFWVSWGFKTCSISSFLVGNRFPQIELAACFLKLAIFSLVCHLHWSLAARSLGRPDIMQHVINPVLCLYLLYCVAVALMGMVDVAGSWIECQSKWKSCKYSKLQTFCSAVCYSFSLMGFLKVAGVCFIHRTILVDAVSCWFHSCTAFLNCCFIHPT